MTLTNEQNKTVENYIIKSGVRYYEIYIELLDHMISSIEDLIQNQNLSFEEAFLETKKRGFEKKEIKKISQNRALSIKGVYFESFKKHLVKQTKPHFLVLYIAFFLFLLFAENTAESGVLLLYLYTLINVIELPTIIKNSKLKLQLINQNSLWFYYGVVPIILASISFLSYKLALYLTFDTLYLKTIIASFYVLLSVLITFNLKHRKTTKKIVKQYTA